MLYYNFGNGFTNNDEKFGTGRFETENVDNECEYLVKYFDKKNNGT